MLELNQNKQLVVITLLGAFYLTGCQSSNKPPAQSKIITNKATQIGWAYNHCFAVNNATISEGDKIDLVNIENNQRYTATVTNKDSQSCQSIADKQTVTADNTKKTFYQLDAGSHSTLAIGMVGEYKAIAHYNFQSYKTNNGVFFYITDPRGVLFWNDAYHSGKKNIPTCSSSLFR